METKQEDQKYLKYTAQHCTTFSLTKRKANRSNFEEI